MKNKRLRLKKCIMNQSVDKYESLTLDKNKKSLTTYCSQEILKKI